MPTIKEVLDKNYRHENPVTQFGLCSRLKSDIANLAKTNSSMKWFLWLLDWHATRGGSRMAIHPNEIQVACDFLEIETYEELININLNSINVDGMFNVINPPFPLDKNKMVKISGPVIKNAIVKKTDSEKNCIWHFRDNEYMLIRYVKDLQAIVTANPSDKYSYIAEKRDCDDFASRLFRAWLSENGIGNISIIEAEVNNYDVNGKGVSAHSLNIAVVGTPENLDVKFVEPQNDRIWNPREPAPGLGNLTQKIRRADI